MNIRCRLGWYPIIMPQHSITGLSITYHQSILWHEAYLQLLNLIKTLFGVECIDER